MITTLSKQGGRRYPQIGSTSTGSVLWLASVGEVDAIIAPDVVAEITSGVRSKRSNLIVRLSDLRDVERQSTADFIKSRLKLDSSDRPDDVELVVPVSKKQKKFIVKQGDLDELNFREGEAKAKSDAEEKRRQAEMLMYDDFIIAAFIASEYFDD